jgi:hypothetical protein
MAVMAQLPKVINALLYNVNEEPTEGIAGDGRC